VGFKSRSRSSFVDDIRASFERVRPALATDPVFLDSYGNDLARFAQMITAPQVVALPQFLAVFIGGARGMVIPDEFDQHLKEDTYMYAALKVLREFPFELEPPITGKVKSFGENRAVMARGDMTVDGDLALDAGATLVVLGDLTVKGTLTLAAQTVVLARGNVTIDGNLRAGAWYSRVAAGGTISFASGIMEGELIAADAIVAADTLLLRGNDVSCRAGRLVGKNVIVRDKYSRFGATEVANYVEVGRTPDATDKILAIVGGVAPDQDWQDVFVARL